MGFNSGFKGLKFLSDSKFEIATLLPRLLRYLKLTLFLKKRKVSKNRISALCSFKGLLALMGRDFREVISYDNVNTSHPKEEKFAASIFIAFPFCASLPNPVIIIFSLGFPTGRT